jgi:hypothetical protein
MKPRIHCALTRWNPGSSAFPDEVGMVRHRAGGVGGAGEVSGVRRARGGRGAGAGPGRELRPRWISLREKAFLGRLGRLGEAAWL